MPLITLEAANIFCGSSSPTSTSPSNHLRLANVKLPGLEEYYVDHRAGGAPIAIEVDLIINKLQCDFTLAGWAPHVDALLQAWAINENQFWVYGALRNREIKDASSSVLQAVAKMYGRLGRVEPQMWARGSLYQTAYSIRGIIAYQLTVNGVTIYNWDFFQNTLTTAGISVTGGSGL